MSTTESAPVAERRAASHIAASRATVGRVAAGRAADGQAVEKQAVEKLEAEKQEPVAVRPTPPAARAVESLRMPAFWLVMALLIAGAVRIGQLLEEGFTRYPIAGVVATVLFTLYVVPFWLLLRALDYLEREPLWLQGTAFSWGALVATSTAIPGGTALHDILAKAVSPRFSAEWGPALAAPAVEEVAKVLGVVAIVLVAQAQINSVLDGVVYGALVGLGFQVVEDIVYAVSAVAVAGGGDQVGPVVTTFFLRGFLAGLWSHMLFSALAGAGLGYLAVRTDRPMWSRLGMAVGGLLAAYGCHFLWNSPVLADGLGYGEWGVLAGLVLKGAPPLVVIFLVVRAVHLREGAYYAAQLAALDDPLVAAPEELRVLGIWRLRAEARQYAYTRAGRRARAAVRRLQRGQARLAVALSRSYGDAADRSKDGSTEIARHREQILVQRAHLVTLGHPYAVAPPESRSAVRAWFSRVAGAVVGVCTLAAVWAAIRSLGGG